VLRVGVVLDAKGTVTVRGRVTTKVLFALSDAVINTGKFWSGCAKSVALIEKDSGFVGVRKPCGLPVIT